MTTVLLFVDSSLLMLYTTSKSKLTLTRCLASSWPGTGSRLCTGGAMPMRTPCTQWARQAWVLRLLALALELVEHIWESVWKYVILKSCVSRWTWPLM